MKLEYKWICPICNDVLKTRKDLYKHQQELKHYKHVPTKESQCSICNKIFKTIALLKKHIKEENHYKIKNQYEWNCPFCNDVLSSRRKLQQHKKELHYNKRLSSQITINTCYCQYCNRKFEYLSSKSYHEKYCKLNPNHIKCIGHHVTIETKQKISNSAKKNGNSGGYRQGSGYKNIKKGFYKGIWCDSSWELAFLIYCLEHNITIKRNTDKFPYYIENKLHYYIPDFIIGNTYIEIKGYIDNKCKYKFEQFPNKKRLKIYYAKDMKCFLNYVYKIYGKDFIKLYNK